ncbi:alpha/beta hydrolase [Evansella cellulosilytica]|uniref:Alpha/beta fold hydrolase n=1 Tax=Evansella cellulosilytica (strain ATCC 21833 / DSM 2522 / FERM P-1141 / JCM 9156 / N-4) TaxID=649639 RepID=E6TQB5_EVAC2|nr:alpha/beta fold hydrolase [Evansella cellulosilytica]ADU29293.1 hypothetical protein Bcell_1020 [Evansella cellulosilytica DSM 2522]
MLEKRSWVIVIWLCTFTLVLGCSTDEHNVEETSRTIIGLMVNGDLEEVVHDFFSDELKSSLSLSEFEQTWHGRIDASGEYVGIDSLHVSKRGEAYEVAEIELEYTNFILPIRMIFNENNQLVSFHQGEPVVNATIPETVFEEEVVIGEGTAYELGGTLTLPTEIDEATPAVILVHGSGPHDRDSTIFSNKPFKDIAWNVAQNGIAVLRYDKRTYTHGENMSQEEINELTVHEETVEDAILAAELLKDDGRIDKSNVYVIGHSLGGMLAPRIDAAGGDFAGIIIMAGSPRPLWEIIYDQNMASIQSVDESEQQELIKMIEEEYEKATSLGDAPVESIIDDTIFGLPAIYFKDMEMHDTKQLLAELDKPVLVLQGEDDFQVSMENDFAMYKDILNDRKNATLISYPHLNHLFMHFEGEGQGTIAEYQHPGVVDDKVLNDIVNWLLEQVGN